MLLPSALSCESRQQPPTRSRFTGAGRLFPSTTTPTPSDDTTLVAGNGLLGTCRALQTLLNGSPASSPRRAKPERLQSPLEFRPHPRTRSQKVVKPAARPPRGPNKRRRDVYEDESDTEPESDADALPKTPKRQRRAPLEVPFGLETSDFRALESSDESQATPRPLQQPLRRSPRRRNDSTKEDDDDNNNNNNHNNDNDGEQLENDALAASPSISDLDERCLSDPTSDWTSEDDRRLVELVLEKLKLSKRDWNDCARRMGKDHDSVGRRWKALVGEGNVGLRRGRRTARGRIDESWRR